MELISIQDMMEFDPSKVIKRVPIMTDQVMAMVLYIGPNNKMLPHSHEDVDELHYVINGRGEINVDDETEPMYEGNLVLVPNGKPHQISASNEGLVILSISPVTLPNSIKNQMIQKQDIGKL